MRLRAQLSLAFLLLAVLPLAALTLFAYATSLHAFRSAVEAEGRRLAARAERPAPAGGRRALGAPGAHANAFTLPRHERLRAGP